MLIVPTIKFRLRFLIDHTFPEAENTSKF